MLELAPNSKRGLELRGPLMLAAGGYGSEFDPALLAHVHALVTLPTTLRPRAPSRAATRRREVPGGFLLKRSGANPGLAAVLRVNRHLWRRLNLPVILTLGSADVNNWAEMARRLARVESVSALELEIREEMDASEALVEVKAQTDLPILARLPLERTLELAEAVLEGGADALTIGRAPRGMLVVDGKPWHARMLGPAVLPLALRAVREVVERFPETPVIGAGGIQSAEDVKQFLGAGARAVEVDVALWREPGVLAEIARGL
jgi:dihydroorotate dehydrogenase (NAD+) catalytic subunit